MNYTAASYAISARAMKRRKRQGIKPSFATGGLRVVTSKRIYTFEVQYAHLVALMGMAERQ
jgi:hypothetical protein